MAEAKVRDADGFPGEPHAGFRFGLELSIAAVVIVVLLGAIVSASAAWTRGELSIVQQLSRMHAPILDALALACNWLFSPRIAPIVLLIAAVATLVISRSIRTATHVVVLTVFSWGGSSLIKVVVHRPRPDIASLAHILVAHPGGFSFPSGHTAFASGLAVALMLVSREWRVRRVLAPVVIAVALFTGLSRVYLGVHYPTDVVSSWVYSTAAVLTLNRMWDRWVLPRWSGRRLW